MPEPFIAEHDISKMSPAQLVAVTRGCVVGLQTDLLTIEEAGPKIQAIAAELANRLEPEKPFDPDTPGPKDKNGHQVWGKQNQLPRNKERKNP